MVKGLKSLDRKLTRTIPQAVRKHTRSAMAVWADKFVASAEAFVPEDQGDLFASIGWVWGTEIPDGAVSVGTIQGDSSEFVITVFAGKTNESGEAFYARWVEFGTKDNPPQPFFFPAYRLHRRAGKARVTRAIRRGLKEGSR